MGSIAKVKWSVAAFGLAVGACTGATGPEVTSTEPPSTTTTVSIELVAGDFEPSACEDAVVAEFVPEWAEPAGLPGVSRFVVSEQENLIGVIFPETLLAGEPEPEGPANKILWIARLPRNLSDLMLVGAPAGQSEPVVEVTQPANSGPGEIYPTIVDVPVPACWVFTAVWNGNVDHVAVPFEARGA